MCFWVVMSICSSAAAPLAAWVKATIQYSYVLEQVGPLEHQLHSVQKTLRLSERKIMEFRQELEALDEETRMLKNSFKEKTRAVCRFRVSSVLFQTHECVCVVWCG